ncbi:MAG: hypothetical protein IJ310_01235 [Clostridia bacterium]|nr:hypothetical protein [Clostridia bacterium]
MKKYDFLFVYEVKNRELENICLLKYELEKRGYSVAIRETWRAIHYPYAKVNAKVVISFACYDNSQIQYMSSFAKDVEKIINLQWEQLYTIGDEEDENCLFRIKELATQVTHICWGQFNYDRLTNISGVKPINLTLAGQLSFDFFKPNLKGYYLSREEILKKYNINPNQKVYLFISSFSYVDMPDEELKTGVFAQTANDSLEFKRISFKSQQEILVWVEEVLKKHKKIIFIYRPHPAEIGNKKLENLGKKYDNFKIIREHSVKQWIIACDKIYTWYSTSVAEIYAAGKNCSILRPYEISNRMDIRLYVGGDFITKKDEFVEKYLGTNRKFPLDEKLVKYYYKFSNRYSYKIICDKLEDVLKEDKYKVDFSQIIQTPRKLDWLRFIKRKGVSLLFRAFTNSLIVRLIAKTSKKISIKLENQKFIKKMIKNNYATKKEIKKIQNHIASVIEKNTKKD